MPPVFNTTVTLIAQVTVPGKAMDEAVKFLAVALESVVPEVLEKLSLQPVALAPPRSESLLSLQLFQQEARSAATVYRQQNREEAAAIASTVNKVASDAVLSDGAAARSLLVAGLAAAWRAMVPPQKQPFWVTALKLVPFARIQLLVEWKQQNGGSSSISRGSQADPAGSKAIWESMLATYGGVDGAEQRLQELNADLQHEIRTSAMRREVFNDAFILKLTSDERKLEAVHYRE